MSQRQAAGRAAALEVYIDAASGIGQAPWRLEMRGLSDCCICIMHNTHRAVGCSADGRQPTGSWICGTMRRLRASTSTAVCVYRGRRGTSPPSPRVWLCSLQQQHRRMISLLITSPHCHSVTGLPAVVEAYRILPFVTQHLRLHFHL